MSTKITVLCSGPQTLIQDDGRSGYGHLGVPTAGAADTDSFRLANRILGNAETAACFEVTLGGFAFRPSHGIWITCTGAPAQVRIGARQHWSYEPLYVGAGQECAIGFPLYGLRSYVAVGGGIDCEPVLGSRSSDTMSGLGPPPVKPGDVLSVGLRRGPLPTHCVVPPLANTDEPVELEALLGPRADWFAPEAHDLLFDSEYAVSADANRVGLRLTGPELPRVNAAELKSEGVVCGSLQVPPDGRMTLFLADHPVTGGYPVIAVLAASDISKAAQLVPGTRVRFKRPRSANRDQNDVIHYRSSPQTSTENER